MATVHVARNIQDSRDKDTNNFGYDASDLGLAPGQWPEEIVLCLSTGPRRFTMPLPIYNDSTFVGVDYVGNGQLLSVFND